MGEGGRRTNDRTGLMVLEGEEGERGGETDGVPWERVGVAKGESGRFAIIINLHKYRLVDFLLVALSLACLRRARPDPVKRLFSRCSARSSTLDPEGV